MTVQELQNALDKMDDGILRAGSHQPGREFCALEFDSKLRGRAWSDSPTTLPDLRPLNDAPWSSNEARTKALLPVMAAYWDWSSWTEARRQACMKKLAVLTVQRIVAELPHLPDSVREQCRKASDCAEAAEAAAGAARAAAEAAEAAAGAARAAAEAAWAAAEAAWAAARAAGAAWAAARAARAAGAAWAAARAARAAAGAARAAVLQTACDVWVEATQV